MEDSYKSFKQEWHFSWASKPYMVYKMGKREKRIYNYFSEGKRLEWALENVIIKNQKRRIVKQN